jgi:hypothetical protein
MTPADQTILKQSILKSTTFPEGHCDICDRDLDEGEMIIEGMADAAETVAKYF